jgi:hypothetical protein
VVLGRRTSASRSYTIVVLYLSWGITRRRRFGRRQTTDHGTSPYLRFHPECRVLTALCLPVCLYVCPVQQSTENEIEGQPTRRERQNPRPSIASQSSTQPSRDSITGISGQEGHGNNTLGKEWTGEPSALPSSRTCAHNTALIKECIAESDVTNRT